MTNRGRIGGPFGKLNNKTKEKFEQDLETHFEGEYEVDFADDWVDQLVMGVSRPIGFKGERKILPRSSRPAVTRQQTQKEIFISEFDSDSSYQDVKKDNQAKDCFQDGLRSQLNKASDLLKEIHSKFSRDSGICEDFELPTSEKCHKVSKFAGINMKQISILQ